MQVPTATIETANVFRPLKMMALIFLIITIVCLSICLATPHWLSCGAFYMGLFEECSSTDITEELPYDAPRRGHCRAIQRLYVSSTITVIFLAAAGLLIIFSILLIGVGIFRADFARKTFFYKVAKCKTILAVFLHLSSVIIFPLSFYFEMVTWGHQNFHFGSSYGFLWGATVAIFSASILLICEKEHEEIYYKEKIVYSSVPRRQKY